MPMLRLRRLEALFGCRPEEVDAAALSRLVAAAVHEDFDLDFKRSLYASDEKGRAELAKDVAAMADRGGLILLGIAETAEGAAGSLVELEIADGEANRMHQIIAERVSPIPDVEVVPVPTSAGKGHWLLVVPPSSLAPHAVRSPGRQGLNFYARSGRTTRELAESEVADRYRARFRSDRDRLERLEAVEAEGIRRLDLAGQSWFAMSLVPLREGEIALSASVLDAHRQWSEGWQQTTAQSRVDVSAMRAQTVGFRRIIVSTGNAYSGVSSFGHYEFHTDGAAFGAVLVGNPSDEIPGKSDSTVERREHRVDQGVLGLVALDMVSLLSAQAADFAGASGDCVVAARLVPGGDIDGRIERRPLQLWQDHVTGTRRVPGTRDVSEASRSLHTFSLEGLATSRRDLVVAARSVMLDVLSEFGQARWSGWREDGGVQPEDFGRSLGAYAAQWFEARA